ncbi:MAG: polyprenyl synthetase family protein [Bacteroidia bacterium]
MHDKILPAYIRNHFEPKFATRMIHCMRKVVSNFVRGVQIEKQWLNYDSLPVQQLFGEPIFTPEEEAQVRILQLWDVYEQCKKDKEVLNSLLLENYLKRTYLINTTLYESIVNMLIYIYTNEIDPVIQTKMQDYARTFGVVQQIVNDVQDFLPVSQSEKVGKAEKFKFRTRAKRPEDTMADIRNRLITLPLIYFFQTDQSKHSIIAKYLKNESSDINLYDADNQIEVLKILRQSGAWDQSHKLVTCFGNIAKEWLNPENPATGLLADMMSITNPAHNQYLKAIIEFEFN